MTVEHGEKKEQQQERVARGAFDELDEDGNGYIPIDELHGLTASLGVPIAPDEIDGALEVLDEDNDGVLDREAWVRWWSERCNQERANPTLEAPGGVFDTKHGDGSAIGNTLNGDNVGGEVEALAEQVRRVRRRVSTDIHTAAWSGDLELVKGFLEHDPNSANAIDDSEFGMGYRPLHYAAYGGFLDVCRELRANGARALAVGDNGVSALFLAAQAGRSDVVSFLLDLGADPTEREIESGLCAADVGAIHQEDFPDILGQMRGKLDLDAPPPPLETPPSIRRVGATSLQVTFSPIIETTTGRRLPVTRYKIKVEQKTPSDYSTKTKEASPETAETNGALEGGGNAECPPAGEQDHAGEQRTTDGGMSLTQEDSWSMRPTLIKIVLVPAGGVKPSVDTEREPKIVSVRGLRPETDYRVQIAAINAIGFGPYGPASQVVRTLPGSKEGEEWH